METTEQASRTGRGSLLGREPELARLQEFWDGDAPALVLTGESGIGKTVLWRAAGRMASARGWTVLGAAPAEPETDLAYAVVGDLFGPMLQHTAVTGLPDPQRRALEVALLLTPVARTPPDARAVALAATTVLRALAREGPVVLAIDDCQWMDRASAEALAFALRRCDADRVRGLFSIRSGHSPPSLLDARDAVRVHLGPLSFGAGHRLLAHALDGGASYAVARRLHESAHGNPLHLLELARALTHRWPWTPDSVVPPPDLADLVSQRVSRLSDGARDVLVCVSAMTRPRLDLLTAVRGAEATRDLAEAIDSGLLRAEAGRLRFAHPLYSSACYRDQSTAQRRALHARLARVVQDPEMHARHLALSVAGSDAGVAAALDDGALSARSRGAPQAAAELADLARGLTPEGEDAAFRRRSLALAQYLLEAGEAPHARRILEELLDQQPPGVERARTLIALAAVLFEEDGVQQMRAVAWQALAEAGEDPAASAEAHLILAERAELPASECRRHAELALAWFEASPDPDPGLLADALRQVAIVHWQLGLGMPRAEMDRADALERQLSWPPPVAWRARTCRAQCIKYLDEFEEADALLADCQRVAESEGDLSSMSDIAGHRAELALWLGRWQEAAGHAAESVESARLSEQRGRSGLATYFRALVAAHLGELDRARADAGELVERCRVVNPWCAMLARTVLAFVALSEDDPRSAREQLAEVDRFAEEALLAEPRQWRYLGDYVEALARCGELEAAADRLDRLRRWAEGMGTPVPQAQLLRSRGVLADAAGQVDAALRDLAAALARYDALPLPFERARTRLLLGAAHRHARHRRDARACLTRARDDFADLGAPAWVRRAEIELGRIGGRVAEPGALTPSEQRVAELVSTGLSNKQVAAALVVTPRTVEAHLTRVYAKLGVRSRVELAGRLAGR